MTTLATNHLTLVDLVKQKVNGTVVADIAEMLSEDDELIKNLHVKECNDGTSNVSVIRTGLPTGTFRKIYGFVQSEKSETAQVTETTGMLEAYSVVDVDLVDKSTNKAQFRLNEDRAFIEGMNQTAVKTIIYGSKDVDDAKFDGLAIRYSKISTDPKNIGSNIVDAGGTGSDNTSAWFLTTGEQAVSLIYPQGSQAGLKQEDDGVITETNSSGAKRKVYQSHYKWDLGLSVKDWRGTVRIANIDVSDLNGGSVDILAKLRAGYYKGYKYFNKTGAKTFLVVNSTVMAALDKAAADKSNVHLNPKEYGGVEILHYKNIPIIVTDYILDTEARVV